MSELSVIVPAVNSYDDVFDCLTALHGPQGADLEILVVDRTGPLIRESVARDFPGVRVISVPPGTTIPQMRTRAIHEATAPAVAVIEDHVIVPENWARAMLDALGADNEVVAGAVENAATDSLSDWAAFLCEYSAALPPLPTGPAEGVPGNNTIYRRETLARYDGVLAEGKWENRLHDAMKADGVKLILRPDIVVGHKMHYTFGLYMSQRYLYSRSYAGAMSDGLSAPQRVVRGGAALVLLPPLMFWRTISRVTSKKRHLGKLVQSLPMLVPFAVSWGAGEAAGYWFGPGDALARVR
ncbi:MAG: glycosyltransferase [Rhodobacteraceae bacterium]|nr:glycosyltransferase [Paracoccaceae bacterium]